MENRKANIFPINLKVAFDIQAKESSAEEKVVLVSDLKPKKNYFCGGILAEYRPIPEFGIPLADDSLLEEETEKNKSD